MDLIDRWKRRAWRADTEALKAFAGQEPAVVITGGSDGIGVELAKAFAQSSHTTVLIARDPVKLAAAQTALQTGDASAVLVLAMDITNPAAPQGLLSFLASQNLYTDILVNSAGSATTGEFAKEPADRLDDMVDLNVLAATRLTRTVLPEMLVRGRGGIVLMSSLGGFVPGPYQAAYYASKAHIISLARALAYEIRGQGVRMTCVAPGPVRTAFHARANGDTALYQRILPVLSPTHVATATKRGYEWGRCIIIPGLFNKIMGVAVRVLPTMLTTPFVAILLKPRPSRH